MAGHLGCFYTSFFKRKLFRVAGTLSCHFQIYGFWKTLVRHTSVEPLRQMVRAESSNTTFYDIASEQKSSPVLPITGTPGIQTRYVLRKINYHFLSLIPTFSFLSAIVTHFNEKWFYRHFYFLGLDSSTDIFLLL